jgi:hypothetical protein
MEATTFSLFATTRFHQQISADDTVVENDLQHGYFTSIHFHNPATRGETALCGLESLGTLCFPVIVEATKNICTMAAPTNSFSNTLGCI